MIKITLGRMMAKRHMTLRELSHRVGITEANLSILKNNKAKAIRFSTLEAICNVLDCRPADIIDIEADTEKTESQAD
ncbi:MAG: helix-turn-helix transcriptional regulator [Clostridia bacterium]|nr:helix-turn-helix transcriptional regulator [Clostridia bacterium]